MLFYLLAWFALLVVLVFIVFDKARTSTPLVLSYFVGLSLIHVPGLLPYLGQDPGYGWAKVTSIGFQFTLLGLAAFILGVWCKRLHVTPVLSLPKERDMFLGLNGWWVCACGAFAFFVLIPLSRGTASLTAPIAAMGTLIVLGLWIELRRQMTEPTKARLAAVLGIAMLLPFLTVVSSGFIGYGTYWSIAVAMFVLITSKNRMQYFLAAPIIVYLGLSLFVNYMEDRAQIREVVVRQAAPLSKRIQEVSNIFENFEFLDLESREHMIPLDERLNQNWLVGAAIERHDDGLTEFAYGATVPWWAPIPRAIWPNKPIVGGGRDLVSKYTGMRFGENTSVGVGQILEFYINFGIAGVIVGFFGLGFLLAWIDQKIILAFNESSLRKVVIYGMPGLSLLQPGGNLLEIVVGVIAALIVTPMVLFSLAYLGVIPDKVVQTETPVARSS